MTKNVLERAVSTILNHKHNQDCEWVCNREKEIRATLISSIREAFEAVPIIAKGSVIATVAELHRRQEEFLAGVSNNK